MSPASNTLDCFRELQGHTIIGVLFDALPMSNARLRNGNKTIILEDGTGLTIADNGSYWRESEDEIRRAVRVQFDHLKRLTGSISEVLALAGLTEEEART